MPLDDAQATALGIARRIVSGAIPAYDGAAAIWEYASRLVGEYPEDLRVFVGLASEWQDSPEERLEIECDIREESVRFIARVDGFSS